MRCRKQAGESRDESTRPGFVMYRVGGVSGEGGAWAGSSVKNIPGFRSASWFSDGDEAAPLVVAYS